MMSESTIPFRVRISTTDPLIELGVRVYLDNAIVHENSHVTESYDFSHTINDNDGEHELAIELFGKKPEHTKIDSDGQILKDAVLNIDEIEVDDIDVLALFNLVGEYHHDFNSSQAPIVDKFYSNLGCNGTVKFKFNTPFYLWLLENM